MTNRKKRKVAVIAVHGVSNQKPTMTASATASAILNANPDLASFKQNHLAIPVSSLNESRRRSRKLFSWRRSAVEQRLVDHSENEGTTHDEFTLAKIEEARVPASDSIYRTTKFSTEQNDLQLDVFELHYADISGISVGVFSIVVNLYQLMFFMVGLSRSILDSTQLNDTLWQAFKFCSAVAERILMLFVPALNLVMLSAILFQVPSTMLGNGSLPGLVIFCVVTLTLATTTLA